MTRYQASALCQITKWAGVMRRSLATFGRSDFTLLAVPFLRYWAQVFRECRAEMQP